MSLYNSPEYAYGVGAELNLVVARLFCAPAVRGCAGKVWLCAVSCCVSCIACRLHSFNCELSSSDNIFRIPNCLAFHVHLSLSFPGSLRITFYSLCIYASTDAETHKDILEIFCVLEKILSFFVSYYAIFILLAEIMDEFGMVQCLFNRLRQIIWFTIRSFRKLLGTLPQEISKKFSLIASLPLWI